VTEKSRENDMVNFLYF